MKNNNLSENYEEDIFTQRPEIGAVGGSVLDKHSKIIGGMQDMQGKVIYEGLRKGFSGYMNRAVLVQEAEMLDIRCMRINPACEGLVSQYLLENLTQKEENVKQIFSKTDLAISAALIIFAVAAIYGLATGSITI